MVERWSSKPYAWVRFLLSLFLIFKYIKPTNSTNIVNDLNVYKSLNNNLHLVNYYTRLLNKNLKNKRLKTKKSYNNFFVQNLKRIFFKKTRFNKTPVIKFFYKNYFFKKKIIYNFFNILSYTTINPTLFSLRYLNYLNLGNVTKLTKTPLSYIRLKSLKKSNYNMNQLKYRNLSLTRNVLGFIFTKKKFQQIEALGINTQMSLHIILFIFNLNSPFRRLPIWSPNLTMFNTPLPTNNKLYTLKLNPYFLDFSKNFRKLNNLTSNVSTKSIVDAQNNKTNVMVSFIVSWWANSNIWFSKKTLNRKISFNLTPIISNKVSSNQQIYTSNTLNIFYKLIKFNPKQKLQNIFLYKLFYNFNMSFINDVSYRINLDKSTIFSKLSDSINFCDLNLNKLRQIQTSYGFFWRNKQILKKNFINSKQYAHYLDNKWGKYKHSITFLRKNKLKLRNLKFKIFSENQNFFWKLPKTEFKFFKNLNNLNFSKKNLILLRSKSFSQTNYKDKRHFFLNSSTKPTLFNISVLENKILESFKYNNIEKKYLLLNYYNILFFLKNPILLKLDSNLKSVRYSYKNMRLIEDFISSKLSNAYTQNYMNNSNLLPNNNFRYVFFKKIYSLNSTKSINLDFVPWYYNTLIRFIENISGRKVIFQYYPFVHQNISKDSIVRYKRWIPRMAFYERRLGHKFFLEEALHIIHIGFVTKDAALLSNWLRSMILRISFWKTRSIFRFLKYIMYNYFQYVFPDLGIRGFKVKLKGKISAAGNSRKRSILYRVGETSHSKINLRVVHESQTITTFTGVMGFQVWLFY